MAISRPALESALAQLPYIPLAHLPTPLEATARLGSAIDVPRLHVKRDDLTGLAMGGNKTRQLEYLLGAAVASGATAVITGAGAESNHCRQLAAGCARLGLRACLILRGEPTPTPEGNLLLDTLLGAESRYIPADRFYEGFAAAAEAWARELRAEGHTPYLIDTLGYDSPSLAIAALGYVRAALELEAQFEVVRWRPASVYFCSGAATQAGLLVASAALDLPYELVGVSASPFIPKKQEVIAKVATRTASLLGLSIAIDPQGVTNLDAYIGPGYGVTTPASRAALVLAARTEGLLLDPTYTAKALAALIDRRRRGLVGKSDDVLFLHTGGTPNLFLSRNAALAAS
ncbi:MAG TPA: pyridoxal-phosphate dependent enzyme [Candidatus Limnocylindria bacterium]|nr:pyridoxal-phosphate dependent enzyme [Candidatus Limnocylindria bacterium]